VLAKEFNNRDKIEKKKRFSEYSVDYKIFISDSIDNFQIYHLKT